jgi:LacI family transcriptional regulator
MLAVSDSLAIGALRGCRDRGVRVPDDFAVVGFDDIELADFAEVSLTTVAYSAGPVAAQAVERMMALLDAGDRLPEPMLSVIEPDLIVRDSTRRG